MGRLVANHLGELGTALRDEVLTTVPSLREHERTRLVETVLADLRSGSVSTVAAEVFCHRNTVFNRLHRFVKLTGHDPTRPDHAAAVLVALTCADQVICAYSTGTTQRGAS